MKKTLLLLIFNIIATAEIFSQSIAVQSNNYKDEILYNPKIKLSVASKLSDFEIALNKLEPSDNFFNHSIKFQVVLFDPLIISELKLKDSNVLKDLYVKKWKENHINENLILFYFIKNKNEYVFNELAVSKQMENNRLMPIVVKYING